MLGYSNLRVMPLMVAAGMVAATCPAQGQQIIFVREIITSTEGSEGVTSVAVDPTGVYVVGDSLYRREADSFVRKYDLFGDELWTRRFDKTQAGFRAVAVDSNSVYVAGYEPGEMGPDAFVRKYDREGSDLWTRPFGTPGTGRPGGLAADSTGVYVAGPYVLDPKEAFVSKYDPSGAELWTQPLVTLGTAGGVAVDVTGVYIVGSSLQDLDSESKGFLRKYDAVGKELWTRQFGSGPCAFWSSVAVDSTGVYIAGGPSDPYCGETTLRKYDHSGSALWSSPFRSGWGPSLAADATGLYVVATTYGNDAPFGYPPAPCGSLAEDAVVVKYDSSGNELWTHQFSTASVDFASGVALDANGIYVAGGRRTFQGFSTGGFLAKLEKTVPVDVKLHCPPEQ